MDGSHSTFSRRRLLAAVPGVAAASVAGCTGSSGDGPTETGTPEPTATATPTPTQTPELPNVHQRTVQRDKAAITHISAVVSGSIRWPSYSVVDTVDEAILGTWEGEDERFVLTVDGEFEVTGPDYNYSGTYVVMNDRLVLEFDSGDRSTFRYVRQDGDSAPLLELHQDGELVARYRRTRAGRSRDAVQVAEDLTILQDDGPGTNTESADLEARASGSGFVVSPDGYVVTNAHVVLADQSSEQLLFRRLSAIQRQAIREEFASGYDLTDSEQRQVEEALFEEFMDYYLEHGSVRSVSEQFNVLNGRATPDDDIEVISWDAEVEAEGTVVTEVDEEPSWGRDVALLKVDQEPLPTVSLGSAEGLRTGEEIFVVGYPEIGVDQLFEDRNVALEPTLTTGVVSARRTLNSGIETIQTDAAINHGNSGGPMYDGDGRVVGVATFGPADVGIQEIKFGLPIDTVTEFMAEHGVENESGEVDAAFEAGLNAYWRGDCETAVEEMETVLDLYPGHPYAQDYVDDCESGDAPG